MKEPEWIKMINYSQEIRLFSHLLNRRGKPKNVLTKDELDLLSILIIDDEIITPIIQQTNGCIKTISKPSY